MASRITRFLLFSLSLSLVAGFSSGAVASASAPSCPGVFAGGRADVSIRAAEKGGVRVNGIAVTDERWYPTDEVVRNLGLAPEVVNGWRSSGAKVYSIGEGAGGLLPWLLSQGVQVRGVDLWYHQRTSLFPRNDVGRKMKAYQDQYGPYLIQGDALAMKMPTDSVDVIVSNKLINNLEMKQKQKFLEEVLRVLKPGGEARLDFVSETEMAVLLDWLNERFPRAGIFTYNEEGMVGMAGSLPEAGFQIVRDYNSGVVFILKRKPFAELQ